MLTDDCIVTLCGEKMFGSHGMLY